MEKDPTVEKSELLLKAVTEADIKQLIELEESIGQTNTYSVMVTEEEWKKELTLGPIFLIEKDGVVVGNLSYEIKADDHVYISGIMVHPAFQGQGIARRVITDFLEKFKNMKRIDLVTHPENQAALSLYQSLGFVVEEKKENYFGDGELRLVLALTRE